jgi:hypothetical protein
MTYDVVDLALASARGGVAPGIVYARVSSDLIGPESTAESWRKHPTSEKVIKETNECVLRSQGERQYSTGECRTFTLEVTCSSSARRAHSISR